MNETTAELAGFWIEDTPYAALFAIGSTTRHEPSYNDIDFLLITNQIYRDMEYYDPKKELEWDFRYSINPTIPEAYLRRHRSLITLTPRHTESKTFHLSLQPEIRSLENWLANDKEETVLLYKT